MDVSSGAQLSSGPLMIETGSRRMQGAFAGCREVPGPHVPEREGISSDLAEARAAPNPSGRAGRGRTAQARRPIGRPVCSCGFPGRDTNGGP